MRFLFLCLFVAFGATGVSAQGPVDPNGPTDLVILNFSWTKERIGWERDPFSGTTESFSDMRQRAADDKRRERAQSGGNIGEANRIEREARAEQVIKARPPEAPRYAFIYKISVKNASGKTIKVLDWDYIFLDAQNQVELGRRQFTSEEKIAPGKTKELQFFIAGPPTRTISVSALNQNERKGLAEAVLVVRIEYTDGTVWKHP